MVPIRRGRAAAETHQALGPTGAKEREAAAKALKAGKITVVKGGSGQGGLGSAG